MVEQLFKGLYSGGGFYTPKLLKIAASINTLLNDGIGEDSLEQLKVPDLNLENVEVTQFQD